MIESTKTRILQAIKNNRSENSEWVNILYVADEVGGMRETFKAAIMELLKEKKVMIIPEENQKTITAQIRKYGTINIHGDDFHLLAIWS